MKIEKVVESPCPDDFRDWEWGDGELAPLILHIRTDTAKVIADQITGGCEGYFAEWDGLFHVKIWEDFYISFDIFKALAVGELAFDDIEELKAFSERIDAAATNLRQAIKIAEEGAAPEGTAPEVTS